MKIPIAKVIPTNIGVGLLHQVKLSFKRKHLKNIQEAFCKIFTECKRYKVGAGWTMKATIGNYPPIILFWEEKKPNWPYIVFNGSCEDSLILVEAVLDYCFGDMSNDVVRISELETRIDIYPSNPKHCRLVQDILTENLMVPYSRQPLLIRFKNTIYTNKRRAVRGIKIYPRPKNGSHEYIRLEVTFRRSYIRRQGWKLENLRDLREGINLPEQMSYRKALKSKEASELALRLVRWANPPLPPGSRSMRHKVRSQAWASKIIETKNGGYDAPVTHQLSVYKEMCEKLRIRARPERVFKRYPKAEMVMRDLKKGFLRRCYE